jgi:Bax protein
VKLSVLNSAYLIIVLSAVLGVSACQKNPKQEEKGDDLKAQAVPVQSTVEPESDLKLQAVEGEGSYAAEVIPENMTVQEKKKRFRALLIPAVQKVYKDLDEQYQRVGSWIKEGRNREQISELKKRYRAETDQQLLAALKPHPPSIAIAQAAMESAWATSRFFVQAKNVFGVWSFDENEPRIAAGEQRGEKTIWVKKYTTIEESVRDNYRVLARSHAFQNFREARLQTDNPFELVKKLDRYSEMGHKYGEELASVISFNKFNEYDPVRYDKP